MMVVTVVLTMMIMILWTNSSDLATVLYSSFAAWVWYYMLQTVNEG